MGNLILGNPLEAEFRGQAQGPSIGMAARKGTVRGRIAESSANRCASACLLASPGSLRPSNHYQLISYESLAHDVVRDRGAVATSATFEISTRTRLRCQSRCLLASMHSWLLGVRSPQRVGQPGRPIRFISWSKCTDQSGLNHTEPSILR